MSGPVISKPVYHIETKRLVVRCWDPKDAALIQVAAAANKEHLLPFMPADFAERLIAAKIMFTEFSTVMNRVH